MAERVTVGDRRAAHCGAVIRGSRRPRDRRTRRAEVARAARLRHAERAARAAPSPRSRRPSETRWKGTNFDRMGSLASTLNLLNESAGGGLPPDDTHCSDASRPSVKGVPFSTGLGDGVPGGAAEFTVLKALPLQASAHH